jgi:YidC/Oxa1 family membrane protein insertase
MAIFKWMGFVNKYAIIPIFNLLKNFTHNYGIIIFVLALIIKLVLTPFTLQQSRYSAKMQILKPELDKLKEKYGDDQQKFSAEQMKIMSKVGMSPLSGCLPMLLQMPILISMYNFFPASIELRQASFLWANDLSTYDSILSFPPIFGIDHLSLFTILMTITSLINAWITPQPQSQDNPGMKYMPYIFPFMLFFMFNSFSAALTYYYLLFNVFSIVQVWVIKKFFIDEKKLEAEIHAKKNAPAKKGGWMDKLENYTKEQQAKAKAQQKGK